MNRRPLARPRPHLPQRPLWLCRVCAGPWPCGEARLALRREHRTDLTYLRIYLASQMRDALRDLIKLNPNTAPTPEATFNRFLAWAAPPANTPRPARTLPRRRSIQAPSQNLYPQLRPGFPVPAGALPGTLGPIGIQKAPARPAMLVTIVSRKPV